MLLTEFFNQPGSDLRADYQTTEKIAEENRIFKKNNPCWKGYRMVGTKTKIDKKVPNCVSVKEDHWSGPNNAWHNGPPDSWNDGTDQWHSQSVSETVDMSDIVQARGLIGSAMHDPQNEKHKYFEFLKHLRTKHGADYSTHVHQKAAKLVQNKA